MKLIILIFLICVNALQAALIETAHFKQLADYAHPGTLIVLDIDDTLLIPKQMLGCDEWFMDRLKQHGSLEKALAEWEAVRHLTEMEIVEEGTPAIVARLQDQGHLVMGLTTQGVALATRTHQQLICQQIDLIKTAPSKEDHYFCIANHGVLFRNGILFTSGRNKGLALFELCGRIGFDPKRIVFINDKATHLREIEVEAAKRGVEFIGLRYTYSDRRKAAYDSHVADIQWKKSSFDHILSDDEARRQ